VEEAEGAQERVLHQVLGVALVLRQAQAGRVERVQVVEGEAFEFPPRPVGVLEVQHPSPACVALPTLTLTGLRYRENPAKSLSIPLHRPLARHTCTTLRKCKEDQGIGFKEDSLSGSLRPVERAFSMGV